MAYDKVKAHQYYMEYRKKGLLKGRKKGKGKAKKGSSKKGKSESLVGVSSSGLNTDGAIEAKAIKDSMKKQMNEALKNAKTDAEKKAIIADYSKKTASAIEGLKKDPKYAKAKAQKASASKSKSGGAKSGGSGKTSASKSSETKANSGAKKAKIAETKKAIDDLGKMINLMSPRQKAIAKEKLSKLLDDYLKLSGG